MSGTAPQPEHSSPTTETTQTGQPDHADHADHADRPASRYDRGLALLGQVGGTDPTRALAGLADTAPDLARLTIEFYADIYSRPGLTLPQRQIINIAALTALGTAAPQLRFHIDGALNVGVGPTEIVEVIMHMSVYAGVPATLNGLAVAKAAFADRTDLDWSPTASPIEEQESAEQRYNRGLDALQAIDGRAGDQVMASLAPISPDFARLLVGFAFADIYSRPGLDLKSRELATVAACTALGTAAAQLRVHLHGLLNVGGTREEPVEAIMQMAGYAGFPAALNGIAAAREVFAERAGAEG
ncbi:Carboxymuconolactone decarboxylase [Catenulispora acidiphila DSM 44928]|uniref:Carboxymuconolactone decarboxylase n=1 Tax=Catenulispora acidiphila (strain DSM 44928 / JCM 14897 / NBRC 102108 / NRRL B-24433 / ID139908) TaxID=479433 RepID=C7Q9X7_CATAD|nr:carboxymuconolactone decarboxylase family protein [Catenulispora acidiphila]ACU76296.1 Carboxymuconolactone decarboxylase [Catenulispora acidiphila DSM 44928]